MGIEVTVVSVYKSRSNEIHDQLLTDMFHQLLKPLFLTVVFNNYHEAWRNTSCDKRGNQVFTINQNHQLNPNNLGMQL